MLTANSYLRTALHDQCLSMNHVLNKLQFDVTCADEDQAFDLRQNFGITYQEQIVDVVDAICSKYVANDEWLRIDQLVIDLGNFTPAGLDINFNEVFKAKFEKAIHEKLSKISPLQKQLSRQIPAAELLIHFLEKGTLPWWADEANIDFNEISSEALKHQPGMITAFFIEQQFHKAVWQRAAYQLNNEVKNIFIESVEPLNEARKLFKTWLALIISQAKEVSIQLNYPETSLNTMVIKNGNAIFSDSKNQTKLLEILISDVLLNNSAEASVIEQFIKENKTQIHANIQNNEHLIFTSDQASDLINQFYTANADFPQEEVTEKYFIKHAGVILLAPFLKTFFTNLDLIINNTEWKDKAAQYKAIYIIWFLSTGLQHAFEYNLTIEKILCGVSIDEPISGDIKLKTEDMAEVEALLSSVIEHWKAIKNTSVNGLRETFLKRDGLLTKQESGWLLQVERKTLDVLIDSIPWGYSTISLPWNNYIISVEW